VIHIGFSPLLPATVLFTLVKTLASFGRIAHEEKNRLSIINTALAHHLTYLIDIQLGTSQFLIISCISVSISLLLQYAINDPYLNYDS